MASSSSSSFMAKTYDVFVSFRGADIRYTFLSHLKAAFKRADIKAFVDKDLERGEEITSSLLATIEDSYVSVVIFSENYAFSAWCLDELVKIVECKNNMGQIVIPVFHLVDPTDVQELSGSFGAAISQHGKEFEDRLYKVETWSHALQEIADLSGLVSHPTKPDSDLTDEIINHTWDKLLLHLDHHNNSDNYEGLVGIDRRINRVESLLCGSFSKVKIIGIWGMGGIGKSTLAKKVYDRIEGEFQSKCLVENVRERFENGESKSVQKEILCAIIRQTNENRANYTMSSPSIVHNLRTRKVCIILDDVDDKKQIESSIGKPDIFGPGSIVIITSRDRHLLELVNAEIYEVEALNSIEALYLFCLHAFKQNTPKPEYKALSKRAIKYAQGHPLALKVLGSNLYFISVEEWEDELESLEDMSDETIGKILRISYDRLNKKEKEIFLFISCFFNWEDKDHVVSMLDMVGSKIGIRRLCDKSLISITGNHLCMHDLLQQMGKDITCEENELRKRMILWRHEDIRNLLTNDEGSEAIKGISLDMSKIRDIELKSTTFGRLSNLRYLKFHNSSRLGVESINKVYFLGGLTCLPSELRLLRWDGCPLKSLPSNSIPENLVELRMSGNRLKKLWSGTQQLGNLKLVDLSESWRLRRLPDFSKAPNVEILNLRRCSNIRSLPENLGNLKSLLQLDLSVTAMEELPQSICNMERLEDLNVSYCKYLHKLPNNLGKLKSLKVIDASGINNISSSWICSDESEGVIFPCLNSLYLTQCRMLEFPNIICRLTSLQSLEIGDNDFESIPETFKQLSNLRLLWLSYCNRLQYLPELPLLNYLHLVECTSLKSVFGSSQLLHKQQKLNTLQLSDCLNLNEEECNFIVDYAISSSSHKDYRFNLQIPGSEVPQKMKYKNKSGCSLSFSLSCKQLGELPFCFCLVYKPKLPFPDEDITCEAILTDELGDQLLNFVSYISLFSLGVTDRTHLMLWHGSLIVTGPCTVHVNFSNDRSDGIMGCGVHPLFEEDNDDRTEEEELPVKNIET